MASPRVKNSYQEAALSWIRVLAFTVVVLIVGFSAWLTAVVAGATWGLAAAIGGSLAGVAGFLMLACGSLYEVGHFTCPACGHSDKVLKQIGYYNCFNCDTKYYVYDNEIKELGA
ncbi:hypothetical protein [Desulfoscipio geothermicus]|uniref:Uncharacterized protein n=1 Tax=Desulfoscipio geothermicus DSM 3669 TaxID=1121426 RepID=A0A1I6DWX6_9FIRM|nr:hypothetical protein [Desulfoscipio geothermicus]SFR09994.1 hypothetical protein SAMN05660706_1208 [Desulfoscipio geothermicus DSM 3669]